MNSVGDLILKYGRDSEKTARDLRRVIAKIKGVGYEKIIADPTNIFLTKKEESLFIAMLDRYRKCEPISKILNKRSFWNSEFFINQHVLDPRPETELIIEMVLAHFDKSSSLDFLDLGTGSGCILLSLLSEYKKSRGIGIDISQKAIEVAEFNRRKMGVLSAKFIEADWNSFTIGKINKKEKKFDVIVSNPPYIKTSDIPGLEPNVRENDPLLALDGGVDGLEAYAAILPHIEEWLKPEGLAFFEVGHTQVPEISKILRNNDLSVLGIGTDMNGIDRVIVASIMQ
ncbi:MAG: peptide chain release factor N(5)-glutamine methyltransferase [Holosporaceae bacterium]|jgi:release factor glutamine methyltransferase|nr:peptide chain release factor N(5)-glutamine methyltransferase [Holosporaceae bacterium]